MNFTLSQLGLINAPPEKEYDNFTSLAAELLRVPVAHISILDHDTKQVFYKSQLGHPDRLADARQLPMELTYCQHVALTQEPVIVVDARVHPLLKGTPAQSEGQPLAYLGLPICSPDGRVVGGLCMMQPDTRQWTKGEIESAKRLAACVSDLIRLKVEMLSSEQLRQEQREFTYAVSHDLKSPANTLELILHEIALEEDGLSRDVQMLVAEGLSTVQRMKQQVEDVLIYSQIIDVDGAIESISLGLLVDEILQELRGDIAESSATVNYGELPTILGNLTQFRALLLNLISNALKFRAPGRNPVVDITTTINEVSGEHCIMVKDNGIGIAPEHQATIFSLFTRLHLQEQYAGTGIGLALCHRVAENHNGTISLTSDGENGSTFCVTIPERQS